MSTPGNGDYRLRDLERRLDRIEDRGSSKARLVEEKLAAEKEARKQAIAYEREQRIEDDKDLRERIGRVEKTQVAIGKWLAYIAAGIVIGVAIVYLTAGQG